jgi:hypothetical protein
MRKSSEIRRADERPITAYVSLRVPTDLLARVDMAVAATPVKTPRHTWILQAMLEKAKREGF